MMTTADIQLPPPSAAAMARKAALNAKDWPGAESSMIVAARIVIEGFARRRPGNPAAPIMLDHAVHWLAVYAQAESEDARLTLAENAALALYPAQARTRPIWGPATAGSQAGSGYSQVSTNLPSRKGRETRRGAAR